MSKDESIYHSFGRPLRNLVEVGKDADEVVAVARLD